MKLFALLALVAALPAQADFSYKVTRKSGGAMASVVGNQPTVSTYYYKGQKMKIDDGTRSTIVDFGARTITSIDASAKTVTVKSFDNAGAAQDNVDVKIDVKETGTKKAVNGFNASEAVMTMDVDSPQSRMGPMQMEMDMWLSGEVPGAEQLRAFHEKNAANFPWAAMQGGGNPQMQAAIAQAQRKMAAMKGVPVQQVIRVKAPGNAGMNAPGISASDSARMQGGMEQARARLEAMKAMGGQQAAIAEQMLAKLGGGPGAGRPASALVEITMDSSEFSDAAIPDSVFAIPGDYQKNN
jgi:hypothetical protein